MNEDFEEWCVTLPLWFRRRRHHKRVAFVIVRDSNTGFTVKGNIMATSMTDSQSFQLTATPLDAAGAPTVWGAVPAFTVAPPGALVLTQPTALNADGSATVGVANASPPVLGSSVVTVTGNGALPAGGPDPADVVTATDSITVTAGEAKSVAFSATTPA